MMEYDFLKVLDSYVWTYKEFPLPTLLCDSKFKVYWSNPAAKSLYPHIAAETGLSEVLGEFDTEALFWRLCREGGCRIDGALAFSDVQIHLLPMLHEGAVVGTAALLVGSGALLSPMDATVSSRTPNMLSQGIRDGVEEIFKAMDDTALKADLLDAGWIKTHLDRIARSSYHMLRIAANVAQYANYQLQPPIQELATVDLFEMMRGFKAAIEGISDEMRIPVRMHFPEEACVATVDVTLFQQAFFNVLHNALYFTRPENSVDIIGHDKGQKIMLAVRDRGVGIPADVMPNIFKPYFSYGAYGGPAGAGLGLALAKLIIEAHGGTIAVSSEVNSGTTVTILLPKASFSKPLRLKQDMGRHESADRFSAVYVGLADAADSPYHSDFC